MTASKKLFMSKNKSNTGLMSNESIPSANPFPKTNWDFLLEKIDAQRCVLFLGPQAMPAQIGQALGQPQLDDPALMAKVEKLFPEGIRTVGQAMLAGMLLNEPTISWIRKFYPGLGFFLFHQEYYKPQLISAMRSYFQQTSFGQTNTMLQKNWRKCPSI